MAPGAVAQEEKEQPAAAAPKKLSNGVVLGPDGKPYEHTYLKLRKKRCRTCTNVSSLFAMAKTTSKPPSTTALPPDCPPDIEHLGRSSWTLLHSMTAQYPTDPPPALQSETRTFMHTFAKLYPCWHCASDFQTWMREDGNAPRVSSRDEFGRWMCEAHNAVNVKLGKKAFDCGRWEERWRTGWRDGRCDF